jgi:hypothetical protein
MGRIPYAAGETTVGCQIHHPATVGTRHGAGAMIAGPHRRVSLAETPIYATTVEVLTAVIAARQPLLGGIAGAATRPRGRHLVSVRVPRSNAVRAHGTGAVLVITTAEEMIDGTDTGIAAVGENVWSLGVSFTHPRRVLLSYVMSHCILENPTPPPGVPASRQ